MGRKNLIAFASGVKESGKSTLLNRYLAHFPRVLTIDSVGERAEDNPNARIAWSVEDTLTALEECIRVPSWHIVAVIDGADAAPLFRALAPIGMYPSGGYSRAVGGVCVDIPEVDEVAPNNAGIPREVRNAFQRGRHYSLSLITATQRPHLVNRVVTSQVDVIISFRQHEPRDVKYLADIMSAPIAATIPRLKQYWHVRYFPGRGYAEIVDDKGNIRERMRSDGVIEAGERAGLFGAPLDVHRGSEQT